MQAPVTTEQGDKNIRELDRPGTRQDFFSVYKYKSAKCL